MCYFVLVQNCFRYSGSFVVPYKFWVFSYFCEKINVDSDCTNAWMVLCSMDILTIFIFILMVHKHGISFHFIFVFSFFHQSVFLNILFIYFQREGKGGRKRRRETSLCEIHQLVASKWGTWPTTQASALTGNQPVTLWFTGQHSIH